MTNTDKDVQQLKAENAKLRAGILELIEWAEKDREAARRCGEIPSLNDGHIASLKKLLCP